jgi:protein involved in polysaccharide export with SLBB domain
MRLLVCCLAGLAGGTMGLAQTASPQDTTQKAPYATARQIRRDSTPETTSHVAASAEQIRVVLAKDPGLLVELERIVEKEALAKGQIVEDSDLSEQAIFDRLDEDAAFRAVATRLLERYGYLSPKVNPDSEIGKEEDLILKERARRLVQIEAQEDAEATQPHKNAEEQVSGAAATCDERASSNCRDSFTSRPRADSAPAVEPHVNIPELPLAPPSPQPNGSTLIQTRLTGGGMGSGLGDDSGSDNGMRIAAAFNGSQGARDLPLPPEELERYLARSQMAAMNSGDGVSGSNSGKESARPDTDHSIAKSYRNVRQHSSGDVSQGAIVSKAGPYSDVPSLVDLYVQASAHNKPPVRFGTDILTPNAEGTGAVPMDLPAGPDYVVGPGDGLAIDLWGGVAQRLQRTVDREGRISLPEYGPVLVSGKSLGEVQLQVQDLLRTQLRGVSADVSLSHLRAVRIYVVGEVANPGVYEVSALSSPLNALVAAGGLSERGSLRTLKHYRGKQLLEVVDAYDLLLEGVRPDEQRLEDGDSLLVPPVGPQITIEGMVRRPAIYEIRGNTSLEEALDLAGGVLPAAALKHVEVERLVAHENRTMLSLDLSGKENAASDEPLLKSFQVQDGDRIHIFPIAPYNQWAIYLEGHVLRPGRYSYKEGMTLKDLISSYSDLLPEPAGKYAEIIRLNPPDYRPSVESFDLSAALADANKAPLLKPLDTVRVFSKYDFEPAPEVRVDGEVRTPGQYRTSGQAHVRDAIYIAGGVTLDASLSSAQIFRFNPDGTLKILSVNLGEALAGNVADNVALRPSDRIVVHRNPATIEPALVYIKGDVASPGRYPLSANMRVEDLVQVAGGLKPSADLQSASLAHRDTQPGGAGPIENLNIDLNAAMAGHPDENKILSNGDVLTIHQNTTWHDLGATVTVQGEVEHPGTYGIRPGESLNSVLQKAGGFNSQAYPYGLVLTRRQVRELEMKSHDELIARVKAEQTQLKALPENDADQKNLKLTAIAQTDTALTQLETHLPVGRVVLNATLDEKSFDRVAAGTPLVNGDVIRVPKKPNYVMVEGQVFNATAVGYVPGRSGNWYLSQAGGLTQVADKKAVFVIRADGSVLAAKNNHSAWSGDPMDAELMPGDVIVVPEKAPKIAARNWTVLMQSAQVATSVALAVAYLKP